MFFGKKLKGREKKCNVRYAACVNFQNLGVATQLWKIIISRVEKLLLNFIDLRTTANLKFYDFQVGSTGFLGLRARATLRSNQPGSLGSLEKPDSVIASSSFNNFSIKKPSRLSDPSKFHWYTCRKGSENGVRVQAFVSKKIKNRLRFNHEYNS